MAMSNLLRKRQPDDGALPESSKLADGGEKHASLSPTVASSVYSEDTEVADASFQPTKSLHVDAKGIGAIRLPLPSSELEILIHNPDGSLAYTSSRNSKCSGDAVLSDGTGAPLIASEYRFGPGRDPVMRIMTGEDEEADTVTVKGRWNSRDQIFTCDGIPATFKWRYRREKLDDEDKKKHTVLLMEVEGGKGAPAQRLAQLVRTNETRAPGSKPSSAGNGGVLMIDELATKLMGISEELVVASGLMMLKKEIDRRRGMQFAALAAMAH
jgi:hypothetical protein